MCSENPHLANGDLIQPFESFTLWQFHVDELGVHAFHVGKHEQLFNGRVFPHVAFERWIGLAPLFRCLTEERHVEKIGLGGVRDGRLCRCDFRRDEMRLDGVGVDTVVEFGECAIEIPLE